jgi:hypothetical protein
VAALACAKSVAAVVQKCNRGGAGPPYAPQIDREDVVEAYFRRLGERMRIDDARPRLIEAIAGSLHGLRDRRARRSSEFVFVAGTAGEAQPDTISPVRTVVGRSSASIDGAQIMKLRTHRLGGSALLAIAFGHHASQGNAHG